MKIKTARRSKNVVLIGSTAERVMRHAQCPVLVVREKETDFVGLNRAPGAERPQKELHPKSEGTI